MALDNRLVAVVAVEGACNTADSDLEVEQVHIVAEGMDFVDTALVDRLVLDIEVADIRQVAVEEDHLQDELLGFHLP